MAKKKTVGKRYNEAEKEEILAFVEEVNGSNGRGGPSAAKKKYGISPLTLTAWKKKGTEVMSSEGVQKGNAGNSLRRMGTILDEIAAAKESIETLQKEYAKLKTKI